MDINIIVDNGNVQWDSDWDTLFGDEDAFVIPADTDMQSLHVDIVPLFKSKSQAVKAGRKGPLPKGWNVFKGNKKTFIYMWNPTE